MYVTANSPNGVSGFNEILSACGHHLTGIPICKGTEFLDMDHNINDIS